LEVFAPHAASATDAVTAAIVVQTFLLTRANIPTRWAVMSRLVLRRHGGQP
jgi:hypothetical protein